MKLHRLNFRRSVSDRKSQVSNRVRNFYNRSLLKNWHTQVRYRFQTQFPRIHAKITQYAGKISQKEKTQ